MVGRNYKRFASGCGFSFKFTNNVRCKTIVVVKWQLLHDDRCCKTMVTTG